jgi:dipeptide/tripeptide permease
MLGPVLVETLRRRTGWGFSFAVVVVGGTLAMMAMGLPGCGTDRAASAPVRRPPPSALPRRARQRLLALCTLAVLFCALNAQVAGALLFWVRDSTDRRLLHSEVPTAYFAALPALLVVCLAPLLSRLAAAGQLLRVARARLTLGLLALALAYGGLVIPAQREVPHGAGMLWIVAAMALASTSEILVMATGMDAVSRVLPVARTGLGYGLWCAALAAGNVLGGLLGSLWGTLSAAGFFGLLAGCAFVGMLGLQLRPARQWVAELL